MEHLSPTVLARLVDEAPTPEEKAHLAACAACRGELQAVRKQTEALRSLPDLRPPLGDWEILQARLVSEGLVRRPGALATTLAETPAWMRAAAAIVLFLGGIAVGAGATRAGVGTGGPLAADEFAVRAEAAATSEEAAELVRITEQNFMTALVRFQQLATLEGLHVDPDPASRLATLDYLVAVGEMAVNSAPWDPFMNGVLASARAERQATLQRVSLQPNSWF